MLNYWQCYLRIVVFTHGVLCSNIWHQLAWWIDQLLALALTLNGVRGELGNAANRGPHQHSDLAHHVTGRIAWYVAIDVYQKDISNKYTNKLGELKERLQGLGLPIDGNKKDKRTRLASFLYKNKMIV